MPAVAIKQFNRRNLRRVLVKACTFINDLEHFCNFPADAPDTDTQDAEVKNNKKSLQKIERGKDKPFLDVKKRIRGLEEIKAKLQEIKGKKMGNIQETLYKKNLKTRLTKQQKKEKKKLEKKSKQKDKSVHKQEKMKDASNEEVPDKDKEKDGETKVIFNKDSKMVFNKFDFSGIGKDPQKRKRKGFNKNEKDPKHILEELKKSKAELKELEAAGETAKAKQLKEKQMWTAALKKSAGEKVKDDETLLKKTIRKQKELKNRHKKKWQERVQATEKKIEDRQKKRKENIDKKKKERKDKKRKHLIKKGRILL